MQTHELMVRDRAVYPNSGVPYIVRTSIGVDQCHVLFDSAEWLAFPCAVTVVNSEDETSVDVSLTLSAVSNSDLWACEATFEVPWEVLQTVSDLRFTFQGTDSSSNHVITAYGDAPLQVVEAGEIGGDTPQGTPTISEWEQAYADAMAAANDAQSVVDNLEEQLDSMVSAAEEEIAELVGQVTPDPATTTTLGLVKPDGDTIQVDENGKISVVDQGDVDDELESAVENLQRLASYAFDSTFDSQDHLTTAVVKPRSLPLATPLAAGGVIVDDSTIQANSGVISLKSVGSVQLPAENITGVVSSDNLPSYVDDVIEGYYYDGAFYSDSSHTTAITGEAGKIYVDLTNDDSYRWSGSMYVQISNPVDIATQSEAEDGADNTKMMTPLRTRQALVQSDWDEGDSSSKAYIANRPFYSSVSSSTILSQATYGGSYADFDVSYWGKYYSLVAENVTLADDLSSETPCKVTVDGTEYSVNSSSMSLTLRDPDTTKTVSGPALYVDGKCIIVRTASKEASILLYGSAGQYPVTARTLKAQAYTSSVAKQLDPKYVATATTGKNGLMSYTDKQKLNGIESGAQVNPGNATTSQAGLMSSADKAKLDGIEANANNYSLPTMSPTIKGGAKAGDGLSVADSTLSLGPLVKSGSGASVQTDGCALYSVEGEGFGRQVSTTGKNLLDNSVANWTVGYSGTSIESGKIDVSEGETLTLSCPSNNTSFTGILAYIHCFDSSNQKISETSAATITNGEKVTYAVVSGGAKIDIRLRANTFGNTDGAVLLAAIGNALLVQLETGSTPTSYEPYSGGVPGPNPSYPFPIEVARGRNLLDENAATIGKAIAANGGEATAADWRHSDYIPVQPNTDYFMTNGCGNQALNSGAVYDSSKTFLRAIALIGGTSVNADFNTGANAAYVMVNYYKDYDGKVQLERGSTPSPYVPYGHVRLEVRGKNLAGSTIAAALSSNINVAAVNYTDGCLTYIAEVMPNTTYVASRSGGNRFSIMPVSSLNPPAGETATLFVNDSSSSATQHTFTTGANDHFVAVYLSNNTSTSPVNWLQVEEGTTPTAYEPYYHTVTPVPIPPSGLAKLTGATDTLEIDSAGHVEGVLNTNEKVFTGAAGEAWTRDISTYTNASLFFISGWRNANNGVTTDNVLCNLFLGGNLSSSDCVFVRGDLNVKVFSSIKDKTAAEFATWLSTHNVTLRYPLATPTTWDGGYITLPPLPRGATVSIPELEEIGVSWWVAGAEAAVEHGLAMLARADAELYEAEQAIADLTAIVTKTAATDINKIIVYSSEASTVDAFLKKCATKVIALTSDYRPLVNSVTWQGHYDAMLTACFLYDNGHQNLVLTVNNPYGNSYSAFYDPSNDTITYKTITAS